MHSLPVFLRLKGQPVVLLGNGDMAAAKRRLLERAGAIVVGEDEPARLALVALDDQQQAEAAAARLKHRGLLVNVADRPDLCDFTLPAIIDRDPVIMAIGTGGASAGLAKALRIALEQLLPARLGELATALGRARDRLRARWPDAQARRHAIDAALVPGGPLDPMTYREATGAVEDWLDAPAPPASTGLVTIKILSADPDDLTLRQARLLGRADHVVHVPDMAAGILARARADALRTAAEAPPAVRASGLTLWLHWAD